MNKFHPLVSIVIPVYNGSNYLQCAIDSALGQDYDNIEIIVVNDGSTDNTEEIIKSYGNKLKFFSKENGGVATALNMAIRNSGGEYISWLSHDDYYLPNKISRQIEELGNIQNREMIIPYCNARFNNLIDNTESYCVSNKKKIILSKYDSIKSIFLWHIHGCALLIPKNAFYRVSFFHTELKTTQDFDLFFRLVDAGYLFFYIPEILLIIRWHIQQKGRNRTKKEIIEEEHLWKFAKRLFSNEIRNAPREEKKIFNMHDKKFRTVIARFMPYKLKILIKKYFDKSK